MTLTGLDRLIADDFRPLRGQRVGLLAHPASVDRHLVHILDRLIKARIDLVALFGPEHGITGEAQDMEACDEAETARDPRTGARVYSLYGSEVESLYPTESMLEGLEVLVVDLQDVGARYYTFAATMGYVLEVAARVGLRVLVLDRPNPLGGRAEDVEGPGVALDHRSFVGAYDLPIRHGLTMAEYARFVRAERRLDVELEWIAMEGWSRAHDFEATGLPWVLPSPNMPTVDTAWIYPGQCLLEGTNLSEGRGTTRPFELCGAPYLDGRRWAERARREAGPGVVLRPTTIRPTFQKFGKQSCGAVQLHVTDRWACRSVRVTLALLRAARELAPDAFGWRREVYEFVGDQLAIDLLFGSTAPRSMLEAGASVHEIVESFGADEARFRESLRAHWLYDA